MKFQEKEFLCRCGCLFPEHLRPNLERLMKQLEYLRCSIDVPIVIISGYRCSPHNASVGGAFESRHLMADAADIRVPTRYDGRIVYSGDYLAGYITCLIKEGKMAEGGVGTYRRHPRTCHYDVRLREARWHS